jgi:translocation and assembly module TamB
MQGLEGILSMDVRIEPGEGGVPVANGWAELSGFSVPGQAAGLDVRVDLALNPDDAVAEVRIGDEGDVMFWSKASAGILRDDDAVAIDCDGSMRWRSMVPAVRFRDLRKQLPLLGQDLAGRASLDVLINGSPCDPDIKAVAALDMPVGVNGERARLDLMATKEGQNLSVETTVGQDNRRIVRSSAVVITQLSSVLQQLIAGTSNDDASDPDRWVKSFDVQTDVAGADIKRLARMVGIQHPLAGVLDGGIGLTGTLKAPELRANLEVLDGRVGNADLSQFTLALEPAEGGYRLATLMGFGSEGGLSMGGFIPLTVTGDQPLDTSREGLDLRVEGEGLPLSMGAGPSGLSDATGAITVEGQVSGSLMDPKAKIHLGSRDAGFTLVPTGLRYAPMELDIDLSADRLRINELLVHTRQLWGVKPKSGHVRVTGNASFEDDVAMSINTEMDGFWLSSTGTAELATSGSIDISGTYPELRIAGDLKMDEAHIAVGAEVLRDTSGFEVDPMISIHRKRREVVERVAQASGPSDFDRMSVDMNIDLGQAVRLRADVPMSEEFGAKFSQLATLSVDLGLDGELHIEQNDGVLSVVGDLETIRGEATALGKRFGINEGTVTFTGENFTNPQLDLEASHQVGQYGSVDISIGGDVDHTNMDLSSPEFPDQTDVMSMLLFGKPTSAMSETEGESGAGLLSAAMASMSGKAAKATGAAFLQNVQIDPGSGSVKVGFPLTDKVYLSIERVKPDTDTDNMTQAAVEWILSRSTYGELVTGDRGKSSGDLYWRWRF